MDAKGQVLAKSCPDLGRVGVDCKILTYRLNRASSAIHMAFRKKTIDSNAAEMGPSCGQGSCRRPWHPDALSGSGASEKCSDEYSESSVAGSDLANLSPGPPENLP